ncbi:MAG: hypothetical protein V3S56_09720 [Gemmatimonadota bacterium]
MKRISGIAVSGALAVLIVAGPTVNTAPAQALTGSDVSTREDSLAAWRFPVGSAWSIR